MKYVRMTLPDNPRFLIIIQIDIKHQCSRWIWGHIIQDGQHPQSKWSTETEENIVENTIKWWRAAGYLTEEIPKEQALIYLI